MARKIFVADSETDPFERGVIPAPFIWGLYDGNNYEEFDNTDDFVEYVSQLDAIIYAHNGGRFDWHFLLNYLEPETRLMVIAGRIAKVKLGKAELRDSYNILPMPLSAYEKDVFDYSLMRKENRYKPENWKKIQNYLYSDCVNLFNVVSGFIENYGLHLTQASAAMDVWSKMTKTEKPKTNGTFYLRFSDYYYGGRVECFERGIIETPFKVVDINSAYPFAMLHNHPWGTTPDISSELPNSQEEIERAFIKLTARSNGAFPFRSDDGLAFPNDGIKRTFTITGWEFLAARDTGALEDWDIEKVTTLPEKINFAQYVNHFYELKAKSKGVDPQQYIFSKLFLNSLYGKFAANPENYKEYTIVEPRFIEIFGEMHDFDFAAEIGPWALMQRNLNEAQQRFFNVATAASITGFVRSYLWRAITKASGVVYCDTDSIVCADIGNLSLGAELGEWDLEAECTEGAIAGKKLYALKKLDGSFKTASKGVKFTPDEIYRVAKGEIVTYYPEAPSFSIKTGTRFINRNIKMLTPGKIPG